MHESVAKAAFKNNFFNTTLCNFVSAEVSLDFEVGLLAKLKAVRIFSNHDISELWKSRYPCGIPDTHASLAPQYPFCYKIHNLL